MVNCAICITSTRDVSGLNCSALVCRKIHPEKIPSGKWQRINLLFKCTWSKPEQAPHRCWSGSSQCVCLQQDSINMKLLQGLGTVHKPQTMYSSHHKKNEWCLLFCLSLNFGPNKLPSPSSKFIYWNPYMCVVFVHIAGYIEGKNSNKWTVAFLI